MEREYQMKCSIREVTTEVKKQEDHDGPISLTWSNRFAYLLFKIQPSSLL